LRHLPSAGPYQPHPHPFAPTNHHLHQMRSHRTPTSPLTPIPMPTNKEIQQKRSEANSLTASVHVGKNGINDATIAELKAQLKARRIVKVRLLPSATHESSAKEQAEKLAEATGTILVDVRGHTAVLWKGN
jgi:RNA-binding protein